MTLLMIDAWTNLKFCSTSTHPLTWSKSAEPFACMLQLRFALLNVAALEAPLVLDLEGGTFGDDCVFIANDWHGALVPVYIAAKYRPNGVYQNSRSILAIHNLRHQVCFLGFGLIVSVGSGSLLAQTHTICLETASRCAVCLLV